MLACVSYLPPAHFACKHNVEFSSSTSFLRTHYSLPQSTAASTQVSMPADPFRDEFAGLQITHPGVLKAAAYPVGSTKKRDPPCPQYLSGRLNEVIQAVDCLYQQGLPVSTTIIIHLLWRCVNEENLGAGREMHCLLVRNGLDADSFVGSYLIRMFTFFECVSEANYVFDILNKPNVFSWGAIISAHVKVGQNEKAIGLYKQMQNSNVKPDGHVFVAVLKACSGIPSLEMGSHVHAHIVERGLLLDVFIGSTLIEMYVKCGSLKDACIAFNQSPTRNIVMWNVLIAGYVQVDHGQEALELFQLMQLEGVKPDQATFLCILKVCSLITSMDQGKHIHVHATESGLESDMFVGSTLIDMYAKCGALEDALMVFGRLWKRDVVAWSALIWGYVNHGHAQAALRLFQQMLQEGTEPNKVTFMCVLKACPSIAALRKGRQFHSCIIEKGLDSDVAIGSALIDMYAKCGSLEEARIVFNRLPKQNNVTWTALITGYTQHCDYVSALNCFKDMQGAGMKPDTVTFLSLLSACSHVGLLEEGCGHFKSMIEGHSFSPTLEHYNLMVDLLGHSGCFEEAEDLLVTVPFRHNIVGWTSLLSSCRSHRNIGQGKRCFDSVVSMDNRNASGYVLMSNIYACAGMLADAEKLECSRKCVKGWKKPAKAFIEIGNQVHDFIVGEKLHPQADDIYAKLRTLHVQMKVEGYKPYSDSVVDSISDEEKEDVLCGHCEKLAIAFGLISTPQGTTIRVAKNLRMCDDCHIAAKKISKIEMREIIVMDSYCIHHFQDGSCSCRNYF